MRTSQISCAVQAPPILLQTDRVRRRISTSESVAALVAELAFGQRQRDDGLILAGVVASRVEAFAHG